MGFMSERGSNNELLCYSMAEGLKFATILKYVLLRLIMLKNGTAFGFCNSFDNLVCL